MTTATFAISPSSILDSEVSSYQTDRKLVSAAAGAGILATAFTAFAEGEEAGNTTQAALDMVADLDTIAIAAFAVCLTPFAAMTTLKFLNMVLGRV